MRRHWCPWELEWENTECSNCRYAMPSISFMNCKLLSGALTTLWGPANIPLWMWKATDMSGLRLSLSFSSFPVRSWSDGGVWNMKLEWGVKFHCVQPSKRKLNFLHISKEFPHLPPAQSHGSSYGLPLAMKELGLLLCKPWKWSSHTVFVCTLGFIAPSECLQFNCTFLWECQALKLQHIQQLCWQQMIISKTKGYGAGFGMQIVLGSQHRGMSLFWKRPNL